MKLGKTPRGFAVGTFNDRYDKECKLQKSSLATEPCIWFGTNGEDMHLTQEHVDDLLPNLEMFVSTEDIEVPEFDNPAMCRLLSFACLIRRSLTPDSTDDLPHTQNYKCGQAVELLSGFAKALGLKCVQNGSDSDNHVWLEVEGYWFDPTFSQFADEYYPVIVGELPHPLLEK